METTDFVSRTKAFWKDQEDVEVAYDFSEIGIGESEEGLVLLDQHGGLFTMSCRRSEFSQHPEVSKLLGQARESGRVLQALKREGE